MNTQVNSTGRKGQKANNVTAIVAVNVKPNGTAPAKSATAEPAKAVKPIPVNPEKMTIVHLPLSAIDINSKNSRTTPYLHGLEQFANEIRQNGLINPITVMQQGERYVIVCGERRYRAHLDYLGADTIPAIVRTLDPVQIADLNLSENIHREDLDPMDIAVKLKEMTDTGEHDVKSLALRYSRSERFIYDHLRLNDLIPDIAKLLTEGKLLKESGFVLSKCEKNLQKRVFVQELRADGSGDGCSMTAPALQRLIDRRYTTVLSAYKFDKKDCFKCNRNTANFDLFADGRTCGSCADRKCLEAKNEAHVLAEAQKVLKEDPKITIMVSQYGSPNPIVAKLKSKGHTTKSVESYNTSDYPREPKEPVKTGRNEQQFASAMETYKKDKAKFDTETARLDELKEAGKIKVFAKIGTEGISYHYKKVNTKDVKSDGQLITDWQAKKIRNNELCREKTIADIRDMLKNNDPKYTEFTDLEDKMMYYFMLDKVNPSDYKALGVKRMWDEDKIAVVNSLDQKKKTIIRRAFVLWQVTSSYGKNGEKLLTDFAKLHFPEQTKVIVADYRADYDKKNDRLDERIEALQRKIDKAKKEAKKADKPKEVAKAKDVPSTRTDKATGAKPAKTQPKAEKADKPKEIAKGKDAPATGTDKATGAKPTKTQPKADKAA